MDRPRILVARAPWRAPGVNASQVPPCSVGVLPWHVGTAWLTVIVKAAWSFALEPSDTPQALRPAARPTLHAGGRRDASDPTAGVFVDDFVPRRPFVDLTVVGSVDVVPLPSGAMPERQLGVGFGERLARFVLAPSAPGPAPLRAPALREVGSAEPADLGPRACHDGDPDDFGHEPDFDLLGYQAAHPRLAFHPKLAKDQPLVVDGFAREPGPILLAPPPLAPRVLVDWVRPRVAPLDVSLALEGWEVDLDRRVVEIAWRGFAAVDPPAHDDVERLIVVWAPPAQWAAEPGAAWAHGLRELPRGEFHWATERRDAKTGDEPPPLDEHELPMARYETWDQVQAPEPELPVERYARIHAELGASPDDRSGVLTRHGLTPYAWDVEERAWAQKVAGGAEGTEPDMAEGVELGRALTSAEDQLAKDRKLDPEAWGRLAVRVEQSDPKKPLADAGLSLGAFLSIERRMRAEADADAAVRDVIERARADEERLMQEERERAAEPDDDESDPDATGGAR